MKSSASLWGRWREELLLLGSSWPTSKAPAHKQTVKFGFVAVLWKPDSGQVRTFPFICCPVRPQLVARLIKRD